MDEIQMGQNKTANQMFLDGANQSSKATLAMNKLFKEGKITQAEYARFRQTLKDDWKQLKVAAETYNTDYANALKDVEEGKLSALGEFNFANYAKMGDIQNRDIYTHPTDGGLYYASRDPETGELKTDPASLTPINNINNRAIDFARKYELDANVDSFVDRLGEYVGVKGGMNISDVSGRPEFNEAVDTFVNSAITNNRSASSILTNHSGLGYTVTSEEPKGDKEIKLELDSNNMWQPVLSDEQRKVAGEVLRNSIKQSIDRVEKVDLSRAQFTELKRQNELNRADRLLQTSRANTAREKRALQEGMEKILKTYIDSFNDLDVSKLNSDFVKQYKLTNKFKEQGGILYYGTTPLGDAETLDPERIAAIMSDRELVGESQLEGDSTDSQLSAQDLYEKYKK
jgi:hypothetical protein